MENIPEQCKEEKNGKECARDFPAEKRKRLPCIKRILPGDKPQIKQKRKRKHIKGIQLKRRPEIAVKQRARSAGHSAAGTLNAQETARRTEIEAEILRRINIENGKKRKSAQCQEYVAESFHF